MDEGRLTSISQVIYDHAKQRQYFFLSQWTGRDLNPRPPDCESGVHTRLNYRPKHFSFKRGHAQKNLALSELIWFDSRDFAMFARGLPFFVNQRAVSPIVYAIKY
jgi:hypothetical protein